MFAEGKNVFEILCLLFKNFWEMLIANWIFMIDASVFTVKVNINVIVVLKKLLKRLSEEMSSVKILS